MNSWISETSENLICKSQEKQKFDIARKEWRVTGKVIDYLEDLEPDEDFFANCELCGKENLRWHFEIENSLNGNTMHVGSKCITKFEIPYYKDNRKLDDKEKKKELTALLVEKKRIAKQNKMLESLRMLWTKDVEFRDYIKKSVSYYKEKQAFTPKQLATLFWRLNKYKIRYSKSDFKVRIKSDKEKLELKTLEEWQIENIHPTLTRSQVELCKSQRERKG